MAKLGMSMNEDVDPRHTTSVSVSGPVLPRIKTRRLVLTTLMGRCLNVPCFRGFASAREISSISQPDVYLQYSNPEGTQRDLSADKARKAYEYMSVSGARASRDARFFTEVVLNVRNPGVLEVRTLKSGISRITIFLDRLTGSSDNPDISRVEGNHRLAYSRGTSSLAPLNVPISFCLLVALPKIMEAKIFRDINSNQRPMNTSHLDNIELQLDEHGSGEASEPTKVANALATDHHSPFLDLVYRGGRKSPATHFAISLRTLSNLSKILLVRSDQFAQLTFDERYAVTRAFWAAVADVFPNEWHDAKNRYVLMKSAGLSALAMLGARVVDDLILLDKIDRLADSLEPLRDRIDWSSKGPLQGLNGLGGASIIFRKHLLPKILEESSPQFKLLS